jgi:SAM-dependent methyltransferase
MQKDMTDSTQRFSEKVANYIRYRPGYPPAVLSFLKEQGNLVAGSAVADVGSGTGIFTRMLLEAGYTAHAVEPNAQMRTAGETLLAGYSNFHSHAGSAETTGLPAHTVDMVVSATAFHWFDIPRARIEFSRILKPRGKVALLWNVRLTDADAFSVAYEKLWKQRPHDEKKDLTVSDFKGFFRNGEFEIRVFENHQVFDLAGLVGRSFSSSFSPPEDSAEGHTFLRDITALFYAHQQHNAVRIAYETKVYVGELD